MEQDKNYETLRNIAGVVAGEDGCQVRGNLVIRVFNGTADISIICLGGVICHKSVALGKNRMLNNLKMAAAVRKVLKHTPPELVHDIVDKDFYSGEKAIKAPDDATNPVLVFGVGGCGSNFVECAASQKKEGISYLICDSDKQALDSHKDVMKLDFDGDGNYEKQVRLIADKYLNQDVKILILAAGLGGGTGTALAPMLAQEAKRRGILVLSVVTLPFGSEGETAFANAADGLDALRKNSDGVLTLDNAKIAKDNQDVYMHEFFDKVSGVFRAACDCVGAWTENGENVEEEMNRIKATFKDCGDIVVGTGQSNDPDGLEEALSIAVAYPKQYKQETITFDDGIASVEIMEDVLENEEELLDRLINYLHEAVGYTGSLSMTVATSKPEVRVTLLGARQKM